jgi:hypothetical protein
VAHNSNNVHAYNGTNYAVRTAPFGTTLPTDLTASLASFFDAGLLSDAGITEAHNLNETDIYDLSGQLIRVVRNQEQRPFTFEGIESNGVVQGLLYPGTTLSTTGATAEVQTLTITGAPTGGTFTLTVPGFGTTAPLTAGASVPTTAAVASALTTLVGGTVTVTGTPGSSYICTFPASLGNIAQMTVAASLTGGTTPTASVATTTPGVSGVNTRPVGAGTGRNLRAWVIDLFDGTIQKRITMANGEAVQSGTVTYNGSGIAIYQFTLQPYADASGNFMYVLDNDSASASTFA